MLNEKDITSYGEPLPKEYESLNREELKQRLTVYITQLLHHNFEKLVNMIYRHDVTEAKFNEALEAEGIPEQASRIADLVIEREMQKVATRKAYRKKNKIK